MKTEKNYISIPWASWFRFFAFIASIALCLGGYLLINLFCQNLGIYKISKENPATLGQLVILYGLAGLIPICLTAWIKKGFTNLKTIKQEGLITLLIGGLIGGLIAGLIGGLIAGCLIKGLIAGLIFCLIMGSIMGLIKEFQ